MDIPWRVSSVPDVRAVLMHEKVNVPTSFALSLGGKPENLPEDVRTQISYDRKVARKLAAGEMFWVSADMVSLAVDAASDVPGFTPETDLPATHGVMVLEKSLPPLKTWIVTSDARQVEMELSVDVLTWTILEEMVFIESYCRDAVPGRLYEAALEPVCYFRGHADRFFAAEDEGVDANSHRMMQFLAAASHLMANPSVAARTTTAPKTPAARKAAKKGQSATVTVVDLRAPHHVETGEKSETGRVYTHRWIVRGHWRNQAYGKHHAQRRITWVPSYTKGPAGKPLKETERVWAWRR
ncbi:conserved hypothetical protein (plasmid) [Pseudarthrobacter chlorophenolicus A6]|uniref:Uncharacterized protein n=1 Tax=Pseudarthrobacter chlorophenolicus (strain ATCC 700700 / DSM 12829 / CIP 107037 / JCM 12360 / KCTC 9906 / NCIMB 13794 / A6) TaxID=452863 RepID=B8HIG5_PSECP|nr:hypothetical protein [Pseudarthrobacter chlorophenolicus]ACL42212.1 conserved hypothetical protein [Pseudarthrobacter chlorophenolicus A6]SDQ14958.1 hypothetical protein SAMN04489738_0319 [Pseudarthrobacter chlorophenolicus]